MAKKDTTYAIIELTVKGETREVIKTTGEVIATLKKYDAQLLEINKRYKELQEVVKTSKNTLKVDAAKAELKELNKELVRLKVNYSSNKKAISDYTKVLTEDTRATGQLTKAEKEQIKTQKEEAKTLAILDKQRQQALQKQMEAEEKAKDQSQSMADLTKELITVAAAYQILKKSLSFLIETSVEFEYTMMNVQAILDNTDRSLKDGSIQLMKEYGFSIKDVNEALYEAISTNIAARSAIGFLNDAARLAVGGVTDLATAVDGLTSIINAYGLEISEAGRIADAFFRAQKFAKATVAELVDDIGRIAPVAAIAGISYQEMLGAISELTLGGLDARESVTVLRQAIAGLIKPAAGAEKALRKYNVPVGIAEVSNAGLSYSLGKLMEAYAEFPDVVAEMIPNIRAFTGVTALTAERLENMGRITKDINENWGDFSSLSMGVAKQMTTTEMKMRKFRAELNAIGVNIGSKLKKPIEWLIKNFKAVAAVVIGLTTAITGFVLATTIVPNIIRAVNRSLVLMQTAFTATAATIAAATAGVSLLFGAFAAWLTLSASKSRAFVSSLENVDGQIKSMQTSLGFYMNQLIFYNDLLKDMKPEDAEYNKTLKKRNELISDINANFNEYIDGIITEQTENTKLLEILKAANEAMEYGITLRNRQQAIQDLVKTTEEKTAPEYSALTEDLLNKDKSNSVQVNDFTYAISKLFAEYTSNVAAAIEKGEDLQYVNEQLYWTIKGLYAEFSFEKPFDVIEGRLSTLTVIAKQFGEAMADINLKSQSQRTKEPRTTIRENYPEELIGDMERPVIGYTTGEKTTYTKFMDFIGALPEDYDEWRKQLLLEYVELYKDLKKTIEDGVGKIGDVERKYSEMEPWQRKDQTKLIEKENVVIAAYAKAMTALKDFEKKEIDSFNLYMKEALGFETALNAEQKLDLANAIIKWNQQMRKEKIEHNRAMLNLNMGYLEDEAKQFKTGYDQKLALDKVAHARRLLQIEVAYDAAEEANRKFIEDQQLSKFPKELKALQDQLKQIKKAYDDAALLENQMYADKLRDLMFEVTNAMNKFSTEFVHQGDIMKKFDQTLKDTFNSMIGSFNDLLIGIDSDVLKKLTDTLKFEGINVDLGKVVSTIDWSKLDAAEIALVTTQLYQLESAIISFKRNALVSQDEQNLALLDSIGIGSVMDKQYVERIQLINKLTENTNNLTDAQKELAKSALEISQSGEKLDIRRETGGVTGQEIYDQRLKEYTLKLQLGEITEDDFKSATAKLDEEIPKWTRSLTERQLGFVKDIGLATLDIIGNTLNSVIQMQAEADQRQYQRSVELMNDKHQTELDLLKNRLDKGLLSEERYNKEKEKIDLKYQRREEEMKRRQFEKDKKRAITQATINGAVAITKTFAEYGFSAAGIAAAVLQGLSTLAEIAVIQGQKYKKGGIIGGKSHNEGGTDFYGTDGSVFNAEKGELLAIVNKRDTALLKTLSRINSIHGNAYFKDGGMFNDGGMAQRELLNTIASRGLSTQDIIKIVEAMPSPTLNIEEYERKSTKLKNIKYAARV